MDLSYYGLMEPTYTTILYIHRDNPKKAELNAMHSVAGNQQGFSKRDCRRTKMVIDLEAMLACPSRRRLRSALENCLIMNPLPFNRIQMKVQ